MPPTTAEQWHFAVVDLAVLVERASAERRANSPNDIVRDALFCLMHDGVIVHRAVGDAVAAGWASPAAAMVRTLFDILVSVTAILQSSDRKLAAFRYLYSGYRKLTRDQTISKEERATTRRQMRERIASLPTAERPAAVNFLKERDRSYWFAEEFSSPSAVLSAHGLKDFDELYQSVSAAAHGGFLGMRMFRDDPDRSGIEARLPVGYLGTAVLKGSTRLLFDVIRRREEYEQLGWSQAIYDLTIAFNRWGAATP